MSAALTVGDSLFTDKEAASSASLFRAGATLAQGGTLSQAAIAALANPPLPNGNVAEPKIVESGLRQPNAMDGMKFLRDKRVWYGVGGVVGVSLIIWWLTR